MATIQSVEALREIYRPARDRAVRKQMASLDRHCRRYIELSPFALLATSGTDHRADVSPRGGEPGFIHVLDSGDVAIPDSPGNNRLDSLTNIIDNPEVGLLFLIPGVEETLRVNGTASIETGDDLRARFETRGKLPATVIVVRPREVYLHCAKALMRSKLWSDEARVERSVLPSMNQMLKDQIGASGPLESPEDMRRRYEAELY